VTRAAQVIGDSFIRTRRERPASGRNLSERSKLYNGVRVSDRCGLGYAEAAAAKENADEGVRVTLPRVSVETPVPPALSKAHWKGNGPADCLACFSLPAISTWHSAGFPFARFG